VTDPDPEREAIAHAFLERFAADRSRGDEHAVEHYRALWPGHEDVIETEYAALRSPTDAPDARIGPYVLEGELGRGAQGVVFRASDTRLGRTVALKVLRPSSVVDARALLRFRREAQTASRLDHPGICAVYDSGVEGGSTYIAMRYLEGETLAKHLEEGRSGDPSDTARLFERVATALAHAHGQGVLHRDLKPGNLMVLPDGEPVILDFGLAAAPESELATLTATGDLFGTPAYLAPERLVEDGPAAASGDAQADVYALGVSLYEALAGERPFQASTLAGLVQAVRDHDRRDLREALRGVPEDLAVIVDTAMEPARERRYASAAALAEDLRRFVGREPIRARPAPAWLRLRRWSERNPVLATVVVGSFLVITTALAITEGQRRVLEEALEDARLGQETRRDAEVADLLVRGFQLGFSADPREAPALFDRALELDPANATALAGRFLSVMPDFAEALRVLDRAPAELADDPDVAWMRGVALRAAGDDAAADAALASAGPSTTDLRAFLEGHEAVGNFFPPVAREDAARALARFRVGAMRAPTPRFHHYHSWMMAAHHAGDLEAMTAAETALQHHWPDVPATWEAVAQFWFRYDAEKAVAAFQRLLELGPSPVAHLGLASWHQSQGRMEEALASVDEALALDPTYPGAQWTRSRLLLASGDGAGALDAMRAEVVRSDGGSAEYLLDAFLGQVARAEDTDLAVAVVRALAEERPDLVPALAERLEVHLEGDRLERALETLD
jgi:serine/threonine protein kinase